MLNSLLECYEIIGTIETNGTIETSNNPSYPNTPIDSISSPGWIIGREAATRRFAFVPVNTTDPRHPGLFGIQAGGRHHLIGSHALGRPAYGVNQNSDRGFVPSMRLRARQNGIKTGGTRLSAWGTQVAREWGDL
jgi:hypothetical protein